MAKQKFKITNWPAYNKALRQRGSLTVWLDDSAVAAWTDSTQPKGRLLGDNYPVRRIDRIDSAFLLPNTHCCLTKIVTLAV